MAMDPKDNLALKHILVRLRTFLPTIRERYSINTLGVFGSYARAEQTPESDLDLVVTFRAPQSLLDLVEFENLLCDYLGIKVDLVTEAGLKPRVREQMLKDVIYVLE
jgi:predicted nucleotidyltransferase